LTITRIENARRKVQGGYDYFLLRNETMASEPKRPDEPDNIVSLREARARQAEQAKKMNGSKPAGSGFSQSGTASSEKKMPVLLIFFGMLAVLVAYKFLVG
jgi:hypothetical protein